MRPATKLLIAFSLLSIGSITCGVLGVAETMPGLWRQGWPIAGLIDGVLAMGFIYYISQTGGFGT